MTTSEDCQPHYVIHRLVVERAACLRGRYRKDHRPSQRDGEQQEGPDGKTEDSNPPPPHCRTTIGKPQHPRRSKAEPTSSILGIQPPKVAETERQFDRRRDESGGKEQSPKCRDRDQSEGGAARGRFRATFSLVQELRRTRLLPTRTACRTTATGRGQCGERDHHQRGILTKRRHERG